MLAALLLAAPAQAAFPGANGKIAFTSDADGDFDIYTVNPDGTGQTKLTDNACTDSGPNWSPDGKLIVFARWCGSDLARIWHMNADGTDQTEHVSGDPEPQFNPAWSPDGQQIAYVESRPDGFCSNAGCESGSRTSIWVMNSDGTDRTLLVPEEVGTHCPDFSDTTDEARVFCSRDDLEWSPRGDSLALQNIEIFCYFNEDDSQNECWEPSTYSEWGIWTVNSDTGQVTFPQGITEDGGPDWSPDASKLALHEYPGRLATMNPDGSGRTTIPGPVLGGAAQWSPDGSRIAFDAGPNIRTISPNGSGTTVVVAGHQPDWQPLRALEPFARPGSGTPLRVPLVPAYAECTSPNSTHAEPLDLPSCTPQQLQSEVLTTSSVGRMGAFARLKTLTGNGSTPADEADITIEALATDVQCAQTSAVCPGGAGTDFAGQVLLRSQIRLTDRASGFGGVSATVQDSTLQVPISCTATANPNLGSRCAVETTADALVPNYVREEKRTVLSTLSFELRDPGPNGTGYGTGCPSTCGDGDEATFLVQGVFVGQ